MIIKFFGALLVMIGGILLFSLLFIKQDQLNTFMICLIGGPTLIYLGMKLLG